MGQDHNAFLEIISNLQWQRKRFSEAYKDQDDERAARYRAEFEILQTLLDNLKGEHCVATHHPTEEIARSWLGWAALVVEVTGAPTAMIYGSSRAAWEALAAFEELHGGDKNGDIRCEFASVDLNALSSDVLWSPSPRIAYAFISEVGGDYSVSLHDTLEEAAAMEDRFRAIADHYYARDDAYCLWSAVTLPRIVIEKQ